MKIAISAPDIVIDSIVFGLCEDCNLNPYDCCLNGSCPLNANSDTKKDGD
jgi:hydrogenase maturation factor